MNLRKIIGLAFLISFASLLQAQQYNKLQALFSFNTSLLFSMSGTAYVQDEDKHYLDYFREGTDNSFSVCYSFTVTSGGLQYNITPKLATAFGYSFQKGKTHLMNFDNGTESFYYSAAFNQSKTFAQMSYYPKIEEKFCSFFYTAGLSFDITNYSYFNWASYRKMGLGWKIGSGLHFGKFYQLINFDLGFGITGSTGVYGRGYTDVKLLIRIARSRI